MLFVSKQTMIPSDSPFFLTDKLANYVQEQFHWYLKTIRDDTASDAPYAGSFPPMFTHAEPGPLPALDLSAELICDCELLAAVTTKVYTNRGTSLTATNNLHKMTT